MVAAPTLAHIEYYDLNQNKHIGDLTAAGKALIGNDIPINTPALWTATYQSSVGSSEIWGSTTGTYASGSWSTSVTVSDLDAGGWTDGLRNNPAGGAFLMGDTHKVNFANFHLGKAAYITIIFSDDQTGTGYGLNPSFSLYKGSAVYQAHDDATADPLNPKSGLPPVKVQNSKDTGTVIDSQGLLSAYRNTLTNSGIYTGQFNALGSFSVANAAGNWSAVDYITSVTGTVNPDGSWLGNSNSNTLQHYLLPAGDYIIAFSGHAQPFSYTSARSAATTSPYGAISGMTGTLSFSAVVADNDGDGVIDTNDAFPLDPAETLDTDHDAIGNNADLDDDGDGIPDYIDNDPLNAAIHIERSLPLNGQFRGSGIREGNWIQP